MNYDNKIFYKYLLATQYFLYFGVLGIFLPYFNLYCYDIGFSGFQIGFLSAVRSGLTILFPLIWGYWADRLNARRKIYISCSFISTAIWIFFCFTVNYWIILAASVIYGIFYSPLISFLEAITMELLGKEKKNYGQIRAAGSVSFIICAVILGKIIDIFSIKIILVLILFGSFLQALISFFIPKYSYHKAVSVKSRFNSFFNKKVNVFLISGFLMLLSHGTYYCFFSIHLDKLGYSKLFIAIAWALGSISEIPVMLFSKKIFKHFSLENVIFFSFMIAALRWFILFFTSSTLLILTSQILHAITYGAFNIASILYIDSLSSCENKTFGQAANNAATYGLGMMIGFFFSGFFYESAGSFNLFLASGIVALIGGMVYKGYSDFNN